MFFFNIQTGKAFTDAMTYESNDIVRCLILDDLQLSRYGRHVLSHNINKEIKNQVLKLILKIQIYPS